MPVVSVTQDGEILQVGMEVEAKFRGLTFRPGNVTNVRPDGSVDIAYVDGDTVRVILVIWEHFQSPSYHPRNIECSLCWCDRFELIPP
jgi:hypothetical protein